MTAPSFTSSRAGQRHPSCRQPQAHPYPSNVDAPWKQMSHAFSWAAEQDFMKGDMRGMKTEDWVRQQQTFCHSSRKEIYMVPRSPLVKSRTQDWEEVIYVYEIGEDIRMKDDQAHRVALEREKARARIQEELRRIEARFEEKREAERRERIEQAKRRAHAELIREKEKRIRDRAKLDKLVVDAWTGYESRWISLMTSLDPLDFKTIPWPVIQPARGLGDITPEAIATFLFCPLHSPQLSRKERIRNAQLRWHPDRFRRLMGRVKAEDKAKVEEAVGTVARCLNDLRNKL
ncbi:hypothetical protein BYT27DRAFT_6624839 [Phlegmacium glaucopus]|nr:hypothetical protein BYT27DRAFT_6624839 [Phlegmacium glaucopus]